MRISFLAVTALVLSFCFQGLCFGTTPEFREIPSDSQLFQVEGNPLGPVLQRTIGMFWPERATIEAKRVRAEAVPEAARSETTGWIRTVLQEEWIPTDISERLIPLKELRKGNDYFIVRYAADANRIQILDSEWFSLLIAPAQAKRSDETSAAFVLRVAREFLNYPERYTEENLKHWESPNERALWVIWGVTCRRFPSSGIPL